MQAHAKFLTECESIWYAISDERVFANKKQSIINGMKRATRIYRNIRIVIHYDAREDN